MPGRSVVGIGGAEVDLLPALRIQGKEGCMGKICCLRHTVLVSVALGSGACATVMSSGPDRVSVTTNPSGATVFVDNKEKGKTPVVVALDRKNSNGRFRLELPGFEPVDVARAKGINGWFWGNILLGGIIGMVVDAASGNIHKFDDEPIAVGLTRSDGSGVAFPAPPGGSNAKTSTADCLEKRREALREARTVRDQRERIALINQAPTCK
jgi:hypothetical protein